MAISGLNIWTGHGLAGMPLGAVLNLGDADRLEDGVGNKFEDLPAADGIYGTDNGTTITYTNAPADTAHFHNHHPWDGVKSFKIVGDPLNLDDKKLHISNFVHVEVDLSTNGLGDPSGTDLDISIDGVKRGAVLTGAGDDNIWIGVSSNGGEGFSEAFRIITGAGADAVVFESATANGVIDSPYANYTDGSTTNITANLGSSHDLFDSSALESTDTVNGGSGNDTLSTGGNTDFVYGDSGNDAIDVGQGDNYADGGSGNDTITAYDGNDTLTGNTGDDIVTGGAGDDNITGESGDDRLIGDNGNDSVGGNDTLNAGSGADTVYGNGGDDILIGESGNDVLFGGEGNDSLNGGTNNDLLTGGAGADVFAFTDKKFSTDTVTDFVQGEDIIDVSALGVLQSFVDSNNDGFVNSLDNKVTVSGGNITVKVTNSDKIVVQGHTELTIADFDFL